MGRTFLSYLLILLLPAFALAQSNTDVVEAAEEDSAATTQIQTTIQETAPKKERDVETIQVTGSHIRRTDVEGPSPVITIDRAEIEASGFNDVGALLRASIASPFGSNGSNVSLRGLGYERTLILIDGHRVPKNGSSYGARAASANFIPLSAVEKIEILTDGASATYGSDALAGVVNIITRKDMDGANFSTKYDMTGPIGGDLSRSSITYADQKGKNQFLTSLQYAYGQGSRQSAFSHQQPSTTVTGAPNYLTPTSAGIVAGPNCASGDINEAGQCEENISAQSITLPSHDVANVTTFRRDLTSNTQFYTTFIGQYTQANSQALGSTYSTPGVGSGITFRGADATKLSNQPFAGKLSDKTYTPGETIRLYGNLDNTRVNQMEEYMGGLIVGTQGYYGDSDWTWDVSLNNQMYVQHERRGGVGMYDPTKSALVEGSLVPFAIDAQSTEGLVADSVSDSTYKVNWANAITSGSIGSAIGATWSTAVGVSVANMEYEDQRDGRVLNGTFMGLSGVQGGGKRQLYAGYAELAGLFGKSFETQLAVRFDQYSDFGNTFNPKLAFKYNPAKQVSIRGSAGTGFNAPSLQDAYGPRLEGFYNGMVDTKSCDAVGNDPAHPNCRPKSISAQLGANPNLKQETSISYNFGVIVEPIKRLNFSVDYWYTKIDNVIYSGDPQKILELEAQGVDVSKYGATIERNANDPTTIDRLSLFMANAGKEEVDGMDFTGGYLFKTLAGDIEVGSQLTYLFHYKQAFYQEFPNEDVIGQNGSPRWRNNSWLGYKIGKFNSMVTARTIDKHEKASRESGFVRRFTQFDVNLGYSIAKNSQVSLGALNVFDQRPNLDETTSYQVDTFLYRPFRITYLSYSQTF